MSVVSPLVPGTLLLRVPVGGVTPPAGSFILLLETGDGLLLETGDFLLKES